jgi:hypothetical protein
METSVPPVFGKETLAGLFPAGVCFSLHNFVAPKGAIHMGSYGIAEAMPFQSLGRSRFLNLAREAINRNKRLISACR